MADVLRPLGMTITHYSCLVSRPEVPTTGRVLPTELTIAGRSQLAAASAAVRGVEDRMNSGLSTGQQAELRVMLAQCVASLTAASPPPQ
jgi:hypothetical protein